MSDPELYPIAKTYCDFLAPRFPFNLPPHQIEFIVDHYISWTHAGSEDRPLARELERLEQESADWLAKWLEEGMTEEDRRWIEAYWDASDACNEEP